MSHQIARNVLMLFSVSVHSYTVDASMIFKMVATFCYVAAWPIDFLIGLVLPSHRAISRKDLETK